MIAVCPASAYDLAVYLVGGYAFEYPAALYLSTLGQPRLGEHSQLQEDVPLMQCIQSGSIVASEKGQLG